LQARSNVKREEYPCRFAVMLEIIIDNDLDRKGGGNTGKAKLIDIWSS